MFGVERVGDVHDCRDVEDGAAGRQAVMLEDRIHELESVDKDLLRQIHALEDVVGRVRELLMPPEAGLRAA